MHMHLHLALAGVSLDSSRNDDEEHKAALLAKTSDDSRIKVLDFCDLVSNGRCCGWCCYCCYCSCCY
jgi:hypothetical protein